MDNNIKIILMAIGLIFIVAVFIIIISVQKPETPPTSPEEEKPTEPVYEIIIGDVKFKLEKVEDKGKVLVATEDIYPKKNITTTEKFIEVTISAQNIGKDNIAEKNWNIEEIIDSEERKFYSPAETRPWTLQSANCGAVLKPAFTPTLCTKIYEVAEVSTGLKIKISSKQVQGDFFIDLGI